MLCSTAWCHITENGYFHGIRAWLYFIILKTAVSHKSSMVKKKIKSYFRVLAEKLELELEECRLLCLPISFHNYWQQIPVCTQPVQQYQLVSLDGSIILRTWFNPKCPGLHQLHPAWLSLAMVLSLRLVEDRHSWHHGDVWGAWPEHGNFVSWDAGRQRTKSCPVITPIPRPRKQLRWLPSPSTYQLY